jgi:hypothetical protein
LVGSTVAVLSSTALYINGIFCFTVGGQWWISPWTNVLVFGINADAILNDVSLLIACGVLKRVSLTRRHSDVHDTAL